MNNTIRFFSTEDEFGCFSNFSNHPLLIEGQIWKTSEHYYQSQKFDDKDLKLAILNTATPKEAARLGRSHKDKLKSNWENQRYEVMKEIIREKVKQHEDIKEKLLSTGESKIIEVNNRESYWGIGADGNGLNMLGKIFMEIRQELKQ